MLRGGREVRSRFPYGVRSTSSSVSPTDADRAATFLAARVAWAKRKDGPPPVYVPAEKPTKS